MLIPHSYPCFLAFFMALTPRSLVAVVLVQSIKGPRDAGGTVQVLLRFRDLTGLAQPLSALEHGGMRWPGKGLKHNMLL